MLVDVRIQLVDNQLTSSIRHGREWSCSGLFQLSRLVFYRHSHCRLAAQIAGLLWVSKGQPLVIRPKVVQISVLYNRRNLFIIFLFRSLQPKLSHVVYRLKQCNIARWTTVRFLRCNGHILYWQHQCYNENVQETPHSFGCKIAHLQQPNKRAFGTWDQNLRSYLPWWSIMHRIEF